MHMFIFEPHSPPFAPCESTIYWRWGQCRLFPVLRENTGKFVEFRLVTTIEVRLRSVNSIAYQPNSLSIGSGKLSPKTGNANRLSGNDCSKLRPHNNGA